jgi:hypothetical protein
MLGHVVRFREQPMPARTLRDSLNRISRSNIAGEFMVGTHHLPEIDVVLPVLTPFVTFPTALAVAR